MKRSSVPAGLADAIVWRAKLWSRPTIDIGACETGWTTIAELLDGDTAVEDWLAYEGSFTPGLDRRGRAAYLITDYTNLLCAAVVPIFVGRRIVPDIALSAVAIRYTSQPTVHKGMDLIDRTYEVRFLEGAGSVREDDDDGVLREHFRQAVEAHLEPLVARLNRMTRLSRSALWRLASDSIGAAFLEAGQRLACQGQALDHAMAILKTAGSPLNNKQLSFFDIVVRHPEKPEQEFRRTFRARGGCCRFYLADDGFYCGTCVLKDREKRDSDIAASMLRYLQDPKAFGHDH